MDGNHGGTAQERIERLAYALWKARGRPLGSPDQDWFAAEASTRGQQSAKTLPRSESNARQSHGASWESVRTEGTARARRFGADLNDLLLLITPPGTSTRGLVRGQSTAVCAEPVR